MKLKVGFGSHPKSFDILFFIEIFMLIHLKKIFK